MAFLALISQLCAERIILPPDPVTVVTTIGGSFDLAPGMAGIAFCGQVSALKREGSCLVKRSGCIPEAGRRMAITALRAKSCAMWILMARSALRIQCLFQSLFVALVALKGCVPAGQIETGFRLMVVILCCWGIGNIFIHPVYRVAGCAIRTNIAMVARFLFHLFRNVLVALQTSYSGGSPRQFMTGTATVRPVEIRVGCRLRGYRIAALPLCRDYGNGQQQNNKDISQVIDFVSGTQEAETDYKSL